MENFKILMALMGLNIGGAETHVLELCKALKKSGVDVFVASNGGVYERELIEAGIHHILVPLHNKRVSNIIRSYFILKRTIRDNNIKLVHAHARIPAFICELLRRTLHFRFVTTVHWDFNASFPWNFLSHWGEGSLAVSEDLRKYLIDIYHVPAEKILLTINGIDTEKFSPLDPSQSINDDAPSPEERASENPFGIPANARVIVHVCRMDRKNNRVTYKLMEAVKALLPEFPNLVLLIVGGGDDSNNIARTVRRCNEEKSFVIFAGPRADISRCLRLGTIFVGISRAALEAMACELPVVLAGAPGYIGLFEAQKLQLGINTNFTCRGCPETDTRELTDDIRKLLNMDAEGRETIGRYNRSVVIEYYSVDRMCRDALKLYETVRGFDRPIDAVISGYYGFNNNGDDTMLKAIIDGLKAERPNVAITVLSMRPRQTADQHNVCAVNRYNIIALTRAIANAKILITGGGNLIQDVTSTQSLLYYLWLIAFAHSKGTRTMLYANGIGPVKKQRNIDRLAPILNNVDLITLRDEFSEQTLNHFGVNAPRAIITADAAFSLGDVEQTHIDAVLGRIELFGKKFFSVSVRKWRYNMLGFEEEIARFCDYVGERYGFTALFIPMRPSDDTEISRRIMGLMKQPSVFFGEKYTTDEIWGAIGMSEFMLGMRLHTLIYAATTGTPLIGLVYDSKVKAMMETLHQHFYKLVEDFHWQALAIYADNIMNNKEKIAGEIKKAGRRQAERAKLNTALCLELMERKAF
ncbi:MAG: polysaccharide pyruvyl transferase CsaB [Clostridiales bacterium]|jgi:polysaccharide pyruvyl transferase CsaB|nr:polysaccharide pyruvyl transferase CsaB [Clostridiales bacterium]